MAKNIGNLFRAQGIDGVFAAPSMEGEGSDEIWGIEDEQLFEFVLANTSSDEKTLNIIMTTSYHPPFSLDVKSMGFLLDEIPIDLQSLDDGSITLAQLGQVITMVVGFLIHAQPFTNILLYHLSYLARNLSRHKQRETRLLVVTSI